MSNKHQQRVDVLECVQGHVDDAKKCGVMDTAKAKKSLEQAFQGMVVLTKNLINTICELEQRVKALEVSQDEGRAHE